MLMRNGRVIIMSETRYSPYRSLEAPDAGVIHFDAGEQRPTALISPDEMVIISSIRSISVSSRRELAPACEIFGSHFDHIAILIASITKREYLFIQCLSLAMYNSSYGYR